MRVKRLAGRPFNVPPWIYEHSTVIPNIPAAVFIASVTYDALGAISATSSVWRVRIFPRARAASKTRTSSLVPCHLVPAPYFSFFWGCLWCRGEECAKPMISMPLEQFQSSFLGRWQTVVSPFVGGLVVGGSCKEIVFIINMFSQFLACNSDKEERVLGRDGQQLWGY